MLINCPLRSNKVVEEDPWSQRFHRNILQLWILLSTCTQSINQKSRTPLARNPLEKWEISYAKCRSDLPLNFRYIFFRCHLLNFFPCLRSLNVLLHKNLSYLRWGVTRSKHFLLSPSNWFRFPWYFSLIRGIIWMVIKKLLRKKRIPPQMKIVFDLFLQSD